tara:strand:+ start:3059 stop:4267 length:1209 start_codon:yes stop_codon:yes gene_type:complete
LKNFFRLCYKIKYFFGAKFKWNLPNQSKVLIYDFANSEILLKYLSPWNPEFLHVRGEKIYIRVLLKSLFKKGRITDNYIDCYIKQVNPSLIVTIVDNKSTFYSISSRHPKRKTLFIQNGLRGYWGDIFNELEHIKKNDPDTLRNFFVDYILALGSIYGDHYAKYLKGNTLVTGSIKNNFVVKKNFIEKNTMALVSQWRDSKGFYLEFPYIYGSTYSSFEDFWIKPDRIILPYLKEYARKNNKRFMIIPSQGKESPLRLKEESYYKKMMGGEVELLDGEEPFPAYNAIDKTEVVIGIDTTMCCEKIARGGKSAIFAIRSKMCAKRWDIRMGWPADFPDEGPFWTNNPDPKSMNRVLDYLFEVNENQWRNDLEATNFSSIMRYDAGNMKLNEILKNELGSPPKS